MARLRRERLNPAGPRDNRNGVLRVASATAEALEAHSRSARVKRMSVTMGHSFVPLEKAAPIELSGADALAFAHAQFASNVAGLEVGSWQWSAWLGATGRTRAVFALLRVAADRLLMWLPLADAAATRDALARFVLRAKVRLHVHEGWMACGIEDDPVRFGVSAQRIAEHDGGCAFAQPGPSPRVVWLGPSPSAASFDAAARETWRLADIAAGLPWLTPATQDEFVPQALDLERLDALRFDKGCYPGQEIAARLHFRGGLKQRLHRVVLRGDAAAPPGLAMEAGGARAGTVLYSAQVFAEKRKALAVLADAAAGATALGTAAGHIVEIDK